MPRREEPLLAAPVNESAIEQLDRVPSMPSQELLSGSPSPPEPDPEITHRLLMRFDALGNDHFFICTGFSADGWQISTAGHCLYNHDPDGDGDSRDAGWAQEVWAWEHLANLEGALRTPENAPVGAVKAILLRSYRGWIDRGDPAHDVGYVTLARPSGG
jgi:hypothetical protein